MAKHEIIQSAPGTISGILPATAYKVGTAMYIASVSAAGVRTFAVSDGYVDGFLSRSSRTTAGLTDEEQLTGFAVDSTIDDRLAETPFLAGDYGSIETNVEAIILEGSDYITKSGTGAITANTAVDSQITFKTGKAYVAQSGDRPWGLLKSAALTAELSGDLRIMVQRLPGPLKP